jgi:hypothetical protein
MKHSSKTMIQTQFKSNKAFGNSANLNGFIVVSTASPIDQFLSIFSTGSQSSGYLIYLLIMLGLLLIVAVLVYNWWEERRFNQQVSSSFSTIDDDALLNQNKQAFLDKFAATTGYLNDTPVDPSLLDKEYGVPITDNRSIEDVYSELLETLSKRTAPSIREDDDGHLTIDHASVDSPVDHVNKQDLNTYQESKVLGNQSHKTKESEIIIPEMVDTHAFEETPATHSSTKQLHKDKKESIRDIIHQAFKAKYNPNYQVIDIEESVAQHEAASIQADHAESLEQNATVILEATMPIKISDSLASVNDNVTDKIQSASFNDVLSNDVPSSMATKQPISNNSDDIDQIYSSQEVSSQGFSKQLDGERNTDNLVIDEFEATTSPKQSNDHTESSHLPEDEALTGYAHSVLNADVNEAGNEVEEENGLYLSEINTPEYNQSGVNFPEETILDDNAQNFAEVSTEVTDSPPISLEHIVTLPNNVNHHVDLIAEIDFPTGITRQKATEIFSQFHQNFDKPVFVYIYALSGQWLSLNKATHETLMNALASNQATKIVASLQLADRGGPATKNTIDRFKNTLENNAKELGFSAVWKDTQDTLDKASSLDAFCIEVDKTMFFHLMQDGSGPFTGTKLRGLVEAQGMVLDTDGQFKYYDVHQQLIDEEAKHKSTPQFMMFNRDNHRFTPEMLRTSVVKAVTFQLDIPHINANANSLDRMIVIAKNLESSLNAVLVDDNNRPLSDSQISKIREQIKSIHATMQLRGITPGSETAHRLFS